MRVPNRDRPTCVISIPVMKLNSSPAMCGDEADAGRCHVDLAEVGLGEARNAGTDLAGNAGLTSITSGSRLVAATGRCRGRSCKQGPGRASR